MIHPSGPSGGCPYCNTGPYIPIRNGILYCSHCKVNFSPDILPVVKLCRNCAYTEAGACRFGVTLSDRVRVLVARGECPFYRGVSE